jgi:protein-tyrosine phosphatase
MRKSSSRIRNRVFTAVVVMAAWALASPVFPGALASERVIDLEGTTNTRDIGGYQTGDLRILRSRQIIRSENLSRLSPADFQKLEEIGVKTVIDLRTDREHEKAPTVWVGESPPRFFHFPVGDAKNDWFQAQRRMMKRNRFNAEQSLEHMEEGYRMIAEEGVASYQQLMDVVLDESSWPILIHCNAGKDRAGIAVTLILEALGVDRETIMDEFLLTNEIARTQAKAELLARQSKKQRQVGRSPRADAWYPIVGVKAEMLDAFYASIEEQYGSMDAFLVHLGVDEQDRRALIDSLILEDPGLAMGQ